MTGNAKVVHNEALSRFEVSLDGQVAVANYRLADGVMRMVHTEVPRAFEGRGIAAAMVEAALQYARAQRLEVVPACSYVRAYMRRHPQTADLLAPGYQA